MSEFRYETRPAHGFAGLSMLFNSYAFLFVFLPAAILIYSFVDQSPRSRTWVLVLLSIIFYGYWDVRFVPLLIGSILVNWLAAGLYRRLQRPSIVTATIALNLAVLGLFKYFNFFADNIQAVVGTPIAHVDWALPLGISFFTFHHVMYLVDLRRGRAPIYPLDKYALYICFFPQAIAGPIARWNEVMDQFGQRVFAPGWEQRCATGAIFIVLGLLQKGLIADPLGQALNPIYDRALTGPVTAEQAWMALAFAFQVFFDFASYSDIAIGLALIFGVVLPLNFDAPFRATNMVEFWQRWHMTLGRFLRDYLFTPLSRAPIGSGRHRIPRLLIAVLLTMALCGLWHGAAWTFVLWGVMQGVGMIVATVWSRNFPSPPAIVGWALTFCYILISGVMFRAGSLEAAWRIYEGLMTLPSHVGFDGRNSIVIAFACAILLPASHDIVRRLSVRPNLAIAASMAVLAIVALAQIGRVGNNEFIYFQF